MSAGMIFNFFAMQEEVISLWEWLGQLPGMQYFESISQPGQDCRQWIKCPTQELEGSGGTSRIMAWPSLVGGRPVARLVNLDPADARRLGARSLTRLSTPAQIKFSPFIHPQATYLGPIEFRYETEKFATELGFFEADQLQSVDWSALGRTVGVIKKEIRRRAIANWRSAPVLPGAAHHVREAGSKLWLWGPTGTV
jgi:hypothetical protein